MTAATASKSPFGVRDFRLLWLGEAISTLGDQFAFIALPWLALLLTGDSFALGAVLALMALPRALFMLIGGAYVDRLSPRLVMLGSNAVRLVAVALLGVVVLEGAAAMWMLYLFALAFGIADAFFYPAQSAMVPDLVDDSQLQKANGIVQGTAQFASLVGPAAAGVAIAAFATQSAGPDVRGVAWALLFDAATFGVSLLTLLLIKNRPAHAEPSGSVINEIREGIGFVWKMPAVRVMVLLSMAANLLIVGPLDVGLPLLAFSRLPDGAAAFGLIMAAFGGGSLLGMVGATVLPPLPRKHFGTIVLALFSLSGICLALLAVITSTPIILVDAGVAGAILGYGNITYITWLQRRIPRNLMGRVMSLMMFGSVALVPISMALSGALVKISLDGVLIAGGLGMAVLSLVGLVSRSVRTMGLEPTVGEDDALTPGTAPTTSAEVASAA
ncbi:MAG TPA: MFS transporter [Candidatus Limnocylindria bacterium]|nr:MFS transporter [Candidatus Limnocylindria bacterium]